MKKFFRAFLYSFLGLCLLFWVIGMLLPSEYKVERSIVISAPADQVYAKVVNLDMWPSWSAWSEMDPEMKIEYGKNMQAMPYMSWNGPKAGMGRMDIESIVPNKSISTKFHFYLPYETRSEGNWSFDEKTQPGATKVTWTNGGPLDDLMSKWFMLFMKRSIGKSCEKGLTNLKKLVESVS